MCRPEGPCEAARDVRDAWRGSIKATMSCDKHICVPENLRPIASDSAAASSTSPFRLREGVCDIAFALYKGSSALPLSLKNEPGGRYRLRKRLETGAQNAGSSGHVRSHLAYTVGRPGYFPRGSYDGLQGLDMPIRVAYLSPSQLCRRHRIVATALVFG